jgi:RNA-directed DNA polymerase
MAESKPFCISKWAVFRAWTKVRANKGAAGVDDESIRDFEKKLKNNLYQIWNRMSSGSYVPPPVKRVMIPKADGKQRPLGIPTDRGTPQGGVISPLLANIFLHHVFDQWISAEYPGCPFERYADDVVIHCSSQEQALAVKAAVEARLRRCKLEAHPEKTRLVYCQDSNRLEDHEQVQFDFLSYSFRPRGAKGRQGKLFTGFLPAISAKATQAIVAEIRNWNIHRKSDKSMYDLSRIYNPMIRGWINYYGRYYPSALRRTFVGLNSRLIRWARRKYKRLRSTTRQAAHWLRLVAQQESALFAHWQIGIVP